MANSYSDSDHSYFMSHILPVYKRAQVWDDNLCLLVQSVGGALYDYEITMDYIVGSCSDGACSPRMYRAPPVLEVDRLVLVDAGRPQDTKPHPDKVGVYVSTHTSREKWWYRQATINPSMVQSPSSDSPHHVQTLYHKSQDVIKHNLLFLPPWYKKKGWSDSNKGPSVKMSFTIANTCMDLDTVFAYPYQDWPKEAEEWPTRARLWPSEAMVEQVLQQGYQLIPKWSSSTGGVDGPMEYHITFALCERYLARQRTQVQKLVYLMAKTLFYTYMDLHDDSNPILDFPSYALKNTMMWLMELTPVEKWTDENVPYLLRKLLTDLCTSVSNGALKNYFMIGANVLSNCTPKLLLKASRQISWILSDMNKCLQETALYKCNVLLYGYHLFKGGIKAHEDMVYQCQNEVLSDGLLILIEQIHNLQASCQRIIEILEQGTGEGLRAKGYLFKEKECFHILKTMLNVCSASYVNGGKEQVIYEVRTILSRYSFDLTALIREVLCLNQNLPEPEVTIIRLCVQWKDRTLIHVQAKGCYGYRYSEILYRLQHTEWNHKLLKALECLPGETDVVVVKEGQRINLYKWSSIGDLIEHYVRNLTSLKIGKWMTQIYSLTHRDIPEVQIIDFARMIYLLYVCDDKRAPD